jgi:hypothetical protein
MVKQDRIDRDKINAIIDYLNKEFPGCEIRDSYDFSRGAQSFVIRDERARYLLTVSEEFLSDNPTPDIMKHLEIFRLAETLEEAGEDRVLVTTTGFKVEQDESEK